MRFVERGGILPRWMAAAALTAAAVPALATEIDVKNDSFQSGGSLVVVGGFIPGEQAGVRLTAPCNGAIVAVQIGWTQGMQFPPPDPSLEQAIHIYEGDTFPVPGPELEMLEGPLLTPGFINEFRYLDKNQSIPLNVPVTKGQQFYVTLEFDNANNPNNGDASVFRDVNGCQSGKNVIYAPNLGGWVNICSLISGDFVIRAVIDCDDLSGACCLPNGDCDTMTAADCLAANGLYQGDLTDCGGVTCPEPEGACCFEDTGGCLDLTESQCMTAGGVFQGGGTECATTVCFPTGACCLPDGGCDDGLSPEECAMLNGVFQGDGTDCGTTTCPDPTGACCFDTGGCLELTEAQCTIASGTWAGPGTDCADNNSNGTADVCEIAKGDMNCDASTDAEDIDPFFLALGFASEYQKQYPNCNLLNGDMDNSGGVDAEDIDPFFVCIGGFGCE